MNKHSENGRKEKQQQGSGKGNTLSVSINKLIKANTLVQALAWGGAALPTLAWWARQDQGQPALSGKRVHLCGFIWVMLPCLENWPWLVLFTIAEVVGEVTQASQEGD